MSGRLFIASAALALMTLLIVGLTGCGGPCSDHGGIRQLVGNGVYICKDGAWQ